MRNMTVTAVGKDRPGIVAGVTRVFYELGCNLADCSMTRLSEQFAMILLIQVPGDVSEERLRRALEAPEAEFGLAINVSPASTAVRSAEERPFVISLYGADHPGIVYRVTSELARQGVNVTDLLSRIVGDNIYSVVLQVDIPPALDQQSLESQLRELAADLQVELMLRPAETAEL